MFTLVNLEQNTHLSSMSGNVRNSSVTKLVKADWNRIWINSKMISCKCFVIMKRNLCSFENTKIPNSRWDNRTASSVILWMSNIYFSLSSWFYFSVDYHHNDNFHLIMITIIITKIRIVIFFTWHTQPWRPSQQQGSTQMHGCEPDPSVHYIGSCSQFLLTISV